MHFPSCRIISKPIAHNQKGPSLYGSILFVWLSSVGVVVPDALQTTFSNYDCFIDVTRNADRRSSFINSTMIIVYSMFIPGIVIAVIYCLTGVALRASTIKHENYRAMEHTKKQNAKIVKMFAIIVIIYFVLTIPYAVCTFYGNYLFLYDASHQIAASTYTLMHILQILFYANSCVNPIIYAKMHREINQYLRRAIQKIKETCCCKTNESISEKKLEFSLSTIKIS